MVKASWGYKVRGFRHGGFKRGVTLGEVIYFQEVLKVGWQSSEKAVLKVGW